MKKTIWRLKKGSDLRFRSGHPWVYSNELAESPKGVGPGEAVELRDPADKFLARGFGNASSLIAFRAVSRDADEAEPLSSPGILKRLDSAMKLRLRAGLGDVSHRLCFGEADQLPGLIIDRYLLAGRAAQVFVVQAHSAGMDRVMPAIMEALEALSGSNYEVPWSKTAVILNNDLTVRKLEGLEQKPAELVKDVKGVDLSNAKILLHAAVSEKPMELSADLLGGQKTGFFLDQVGNVQLAALRLLPMKRQGTIRILDLCCYVGQWGSQLARAFKDAGVNVEVVAFDASTKALDFARKNLEAQGAKAQTIQGDVLRDLEKLEPAQFDIVVSDPPALIKGRKDMPQGTHAYLQLNTQVFRLVKKDGAVVSCSCSALLEEEQFLKTLSKAAYRNQVKMRWVARGGQSADHPILAEFPEGRYLKCWVGYVG